MKLPIDWKTVRGYAGLYQVSNTGDVRAVKRSRSSGAYLKQSQHRGYMQVWLSKDNKVRKISVHRLVAKAFIPNPSHKPQVNHIDGDRANNLATNLEWVTRKENEAHKSGVLGRTDRGEKNGHFGYRKAKLYPSEELRSKLCALGVPRWKHSLAELGEMLPAQIHPPGSGGEHPVHQFVTEKQFSQWHAVYICAGCQGKFGSQLADTEADARAKMLVYILEHKLLTPPSKK